VQFSLVLEHLLLLLDQAVDFFLPKVNVAEKSNTLNLMVVLQTLDLDFIILEFEKS